MMEMLHLLLLVQRDLVKSLRLYKIQMILMAMGNLTISGNSHLIMD